MRGVPLSRSQLWQSAPLWGAAPPPADQETEEPGLAGFEKQTGSPPASPNRQRPHPGGTVRPCVRPRGRPRGAPGHRVLGSLTHAPSKWLGSGALGAFPPGPLGALPTSTWVSSLGGRRGPGPRWGSHPSPRLSHDPTRRGPASLDASGQMRHRTETGAGLSPPRAGRGLREPHSCHLVEKGDSEDGARSEEGPARDVDAAPSRGWPRARRVSGSPRASHRPGLNRGRRG